ncbi:GNAT family N-acetyltransferase [Chitinophaga cymbidii]|uniref:N-acetyltransferase n=1 Tax=Chitinophaga cymbidii TaxID=1096750 RepID=A0A512RFI0_9BACT|nr:N-acetyltransferase [Chitinophaga cymbidii]GEP94463.1 N-acetyltransferase [Chitinophaga cymbidii]
MNIRIRPEETSDAGHIYEVNRLAFGREDESRLIGFLREGGSFVPALSLLAEVDGMAVGHILFTRIFIARENGARIESLALAPMAVHPDFQRRGIGGRLITEGLRRAGEAGFTAVIVLGHADYYPKFGFAPAAKWGITTLYDVPEEVFMAMELKPGALDDASGTVVYPEAFERV